MIKPKLKLYYPDFWDVWNMEDNYFTNILKMDFDVEITPDNPDIIIYSWEGKKFLDYKCIRVYYTPENWLMPKYKECDFSMSFEYWDDKRNLRVPNYLLYEIHPDQLDKSKLDIQQLIDNRKGFCSMVVSNPNTQIRNDFFHKLSKYKQVDSGGKHLNNIGGRVGNKREFVSQYKFNLCFENAQHPGYTTEKIVEAMSSMTVPLYWGNPLVGYEFNTKSFFNYFDYTTEDDMIEDIIEHDKNPDKYYKKFIEPWFVNNIPNQYFDEQRVRKFLFDIINNKDNYIPIAQNIFKQKIYYPLGNQINLAKGAVKKIIGK